MTIFWWARALKASHMEQARSYINVYARCEGTRADLEMAFGHLRAIDAVEASVDKEKGTFRDIKARALLVSTPLCIAAIIEAYGTWVTAKDNETAKDARMKPLEILDDFEELHRHIIYS